MNTKSLLQRMFVIACVTCAAVSTSSAAEDFPANAVTITTSFPAGGGTDTLARIVSQHLGEQWNAAVVVENRPGGNGIVGARAALGAPADGYNLYMGSFNHMVILPTVYSNIPFDPVGDFEPIIPVGNQHFVLVVNQSVPVDTVDELIELARSTPGEINYASPGIGVIEDLAGRFLQARTGIEIESIPYNGSADALTALAGNQVQVMFGSIASVMSYVRSGQFKALAITAPQRSPALPDVPTTAEAGLSDFIMYSWNGLFAPKGTPEAVIEKINADVDAILKSEAVLDRLRTLGVEPMGGSVGDFSELLDADLERWDEIVRESGIDKQEL